MEIEELEIKIKQSVKKLIFIIGDDLKKKADFFKDFAQKENYSFLTFQELMFALTTIEGDFADFPSIRDQLIVLITALISKEKTKGVIIDQFDFDIIIKFQVQIRLLQEFKRYPKDPTAKGKLILINYGKPLEDMFESEFINSCSVIRLQI
ncbi:MAG: hypothetical protein HZR80_16220 [Candidatus Heimdallarchaeota archaeon]